jgi:hypothetical protein
MPDQVIKVYLEASRERDKKPFYVAQWVVHWMSIFLRFSKTAKPYSYFDPFKKGFKARKRTKAEIDAINKKMDRIKKEGKKTISSNFNI